MSVEQPLWRALAVFRTLALVYAIVKYAEYSGDYDHPVGGWLVIAGITAWTVFSISAYRASKMRGWWLVAADLAVTFGAVVSTRWLNDAEKVADGAMTLPTVWASAAVLAAAITGGWAAGLAGALVIGVADLIERGSLSATNQHNIVLLLLAGTAIGYVVELARSSERVLARALQLEAATRERERLARDIHDSVLQVLALVQRRGAEIGGDAAELGRLAGEQEVALRALIQPSPAEVSAADVPDEHGTIARQDLRTLLSRFTSAKVTVSTPATPVQLPSHAAREIEAAVGACLDNVRRHAGDSANAWILLEDEEDDLLVSVRDDGPGIPAGRLEAARAQGRLGVAQSIEGRIRDLGGTVTVFSVPGEGCEIEMQIPKAGLVEPS